MGTYHNDIIEVRKDGKWVVDNTPEDAYPCFSKYYGIYGFIADVRNDYGRPTLGTKDLPEDSEYLNTPLPEPREYAYDYYTNGIAYTNKDAIEKDGDTCGYTYVTLRELLEFDYDKPFVSNTGTEETMRDVLSRSEAFFPFLDYLKTLGGPDDVRYIIWFN